MSLTAVATVERRVSAASASPGRQALPAAPRGSDAPPRAENASSRVLRPKDHSQPAAEQSERGAATDAVRTRVIQPRAKRRKTSNATATAPTEPLDPCAAAFLRDTLGADKYDTFVARLFERRLKDASNDEQDDAPRVGGASALDFLVKVEVVKEVLRKFVPHPYNSIKSLAHPYAASPSGTVTLTRQTVLTLTGWSNTQFSYWARRVEGISVLRTYDPALGALANALERRLSWEPAPPESLPLVESITGKGLDAHITAVVKKHDVSPFLRGRHCSLDPFGAGGMGVVADDTPVVASEPVPKADPVHVHTSVALKLVQKPAPLSLFSTGQLGSRLSYSVSDSRSSGKRRRDDDDVDQSCSDEEREDSCDLSAGSSSSSPWKPVPPAPAQLVLSRS